MNLKIKKAGIIVSIIIVIIILVDLLFNFSGVLNERFQAGGGEGATETEQNAEKQEQKERHNRAKASSNNDVNNNTDDKEIKSIESEYSSERFNVLSVDGTIPTTTINIKTSSFNSLSFDDNGGLTRSATTLGDQKQQFTLVKINNFEEVEKFMIDRNIETYFPAPVEFPYYYILAPGTEDKVLNVGDEDLSLRKPNNRNNQIFHVHNTPYLGLDNKPNDQIDIKIKLDQESINTIIDKLGFADINNTASDFDTDLDKDCNLDNWIPRDAVNSMCPLCDPDLID